MRRFLLRASLPVASLVLLAYLEATGTDPRTWLDALVVLGAAVTGAAIWSDAFEAYCDAHLSDGDEDRH